MNNFNDKNGLKKIIAVLFVSGSLLFVAQSIFAQTGTIFSIYDTTAPVISEVRVENIAEYIAQIKWKTDEPSDSFVYYGMTSSGLNFYPQNRCDGIGNVLEHCVTLVNLYPNTKYYYKAQSRNFVGLSADSTGYFATLPISGMYTTFTSTDLNTSTSSNLTSTATSGGTISIATTTSGGTTATATTSVTATVTSGSTTDAQTTTSSQVTATATSGTLSMQTTATATSGTEGTQTNTIATSTAVAVNTGTQTTTSSKTTTIATPQVVPTSIPLATTQISYPAAPVISPVPVPSVSAPVLPTKLLTPTVPSFLPKAEGLVSKMVLKGGGNVVNGEDVYVKANQMVKSVEVRLLREDNPTSLYLGQAKFDLKNAQWVFHWDSTQTPDGKYAILSVVTTNNNEVIQGDKRTIIVKNEKMAQPSSIAAGGKIHATSTVAIQEEDVPRVATHAFVDTETFIEQIKKENQRIEEQAKKDIADVLLIPEAAKKDANSLAFRTEATKQLEELRTAIDEGDDAKKKEIMSDIVNMAAMSLKDVPQDVLVKRVEESVAKLEQVVAEQKNGVVDTENFKVTTVETAEVAARPDGTSTASKISFKGKALPNSFATLYIFSIPVVVTVKTDSDGYWNYILDKELEDGEHQVFVAITDVKGTVVVKSEPVPFIKEASAITVDRIAVAPAQQEAPSFAGHNYLYGSVIAIVFVVVFILMLLGINRRNTPQ